MNYIKKRYYRIIESVVKKILLSKNNLNNKNLDKAIRSAIYNVKNNKDGLNLSIFALCLSMTDAAKLLFCEI